MLASVNANNASTPTRFTIFGQIYNRPAKTRDRVMPTYLGAGYERPYPGYVSFSVRGYHTPPIITPKIDYLGRYAIADLVPINRPLPWERIIK